MKEFNIVTINRYLLYKQHLLPGSETQSIVQVADDLCGLHATCPSTPYLSLFARLNNFSKADLKKEVEEKKSLIRTRSIRNTLHLLPVSKSSMIFAALKFQQNRRSEKYIRHLGITMDEFNRLTDRIIFALSGRGLTANEIKKETGNSKNTSHVINILCDEGLVVRGQINGGWKSNNHRYYMFGDYFGKTSNKSVLTEDAYQSLIISYIKTYGPVTEDDISWWSGISKSAVKKVLNDNQKKIKQVKFNGLPGSFTMLNSDFRKFTSIKTGDGIVVHFLPALDSFVMGYKKRERFINTAYYDYVFDRFGNAAPVIILNGEIIGIWDIEDEKNLVKFFLFEQTEENIYEKVIKSGLKTGFFSCGYDADILEIRKTKPVKELTVGSFMSPLKDALKNDNEQ